MPLTSPLHELVASTESPCGSLMSTFVRCGWRYQGPTAKRDSGAGALV